MKFELWNDHLAKCAVQTAGAIGGVGRQVRNLVMNKDLKFSNGRVKCHWEIPIFCPYLWGKIKWRLMGQKTMSANESGLRPLYRITQQLYSCLIRRKYGGWTYIQGAQLNVKLWPRFKRHWWPRYGVTAVYKITRIRRFRKRMGRSGRFTGVANFTDVTVFSE